MFCACVLTLVQAKSYEVPPAKSLGMKRYQFARCVEDHFATEFDEQALSGSGESGFDGAIMFPLKSAQRMFMITTNGNPVEGYLKRFDNQKGRAVQTWSIKLKWIGKKIKGGKCTLFSLLYNHGYSFQPSEMTPDVRADFATTSPMVLYRQDKIASLHVSIIASNYRELTTKLKQSRPLEKGGLPLSSRD